MIIAMPRNSLKIHCSYLIDDGNSSHIKDQIMLPLPMLGLKIVDVEVTDGEVAI